MNLSEKQKEAATCLEGQVMVVSCPGSGKTTTIVARTHEMVKAGIDPMSILVLTFTKEAAMQMMKRYQKEFPDDPRTVSWGTIHSFCYRVLAQADRLTADDILKESEAWNFFREFVISNRIQAEDFDDYIKGLIGEISAARNSETPPERYKPKKSDREIFMKAFREYGEYKRRTGKIDFDDMILFARDRFRTDGAALAGWQNRYRYVMVDEFQDTNRIQADVIYMLAGEDGNLCIVGDDDQSIYAFRSADSSIMLDFPKEYPKCRTFYLDTNYRCAKSIVEASSKLIRANKKRFSKDIMAHKDESGAIEVMPLADTAAQAKLVAEEAEALKASGKPLEGMAVLYRTNTQNQLAIGEYIKRGIPFYTTEPARDFHNDFIFGDIMAYWRLAEGNWRRGDLQRILNRPSRYLKAAPFKDCSFVKKDMLKACRNLEDRMYGKAVREIEDLFYYTEQLKGRNKPEDFLKYLLDFIGYRDFTKHFAEFTKRDLSSVQALLETVTAEGKEFDTMEEWSDYAKAYGEHLAECRASRRREGVCFSTFHAAKGLEWDFVHIIDANEGCCPHSLSETPADYEEERRMFYVASTRAASRLAISYTSGTAEHPLFPTRYLKEMGLDAPEAAAKDSSRESGKKLSSKKIKTRDPAKRKFYAVQQVDGKPVNRIFYSWHGKDGCRGIVEGHKNARYKSFGTLREAQGWLKKSV